ncbi:MAG: cyclohydrolase [Burkholderiales bacterium]|jgi:GTP cyclohydrolase I|nr:cyclohydrolase [Burkholderiales bacterium]
MKNTNHELGLQIHQLLKQKSLENSINWKTIDAWQDTNYIKQLEDKFTDFVRHLGLDLSDELLVDTPSRIVRLFVDDLFWGLDYYNFPDIIAEGNAIKYTQPIVSKNIQLKSTCEHHFVAIKGHVTIAYIPGGKIIGLGKLNQIVDFFAHRPQIQERLTRQISVVLQHLLKTKSVAVAITAHHDCVNRSGVSDTENKVQTFDLSGKFASDDILKASFLSNVNQ